MTHFFVYLMEFEFILLLFFFFPLFPLFSIRFLFGLFLYYYCHSLLLCYSATGSCSSSVDNRRKAIPRTHKSRVVDPIGSTCLACLGSHQEMFSHHYFSQQQHQQFPQSSPLLD